MKSTHLSPAEALSRLPGPSGERFVTLFRRGTLEVEFYAPRGHDPQTPHGRDEVYVVVSGRGDFVHDGRRTPFGPGDCLFVAAGVEHRFERFSEDFGAWVFFYGPEGGEGRASGHGVSGGRRIADDAETRELLRRHSKLPRAGR